MQTDPMPLHGLTLEKLLSPGDGLALGLDGELVWSWNQIVLQHRYTGIPPGFCSDAERQKAISRWEAQYRAYRQTHDHFCNGVQREHNKKLNNGLPILHKVPPKRDYRRYFCIMAEKGGTSHGGLTEKLSPFFMPKNRR